MFLSPDELLILPCEVMQRFANPSKITDKHAVEVGKPHETSCLCDVLRCRLLRNRTNLCGLHSNFSWRYEVAKKNCLVFVKLALFSVDREVMCMECVQHLLHMPLVFVESFREDKDVVKVTHDRPVEKRAYGVVDSGLECCGCVRQPKR